jgi:hypothetical protein
MEQRSWLATIKKEANLALPGPDCAKSCSTARA